MRNPNLHVAGPRRFDLHVVADLERLARGFQNGCAHRHLPRKALPYSIPRGSMPLTPETRAFLETLGGGLTVNYDELSVEMIRKGFDAVTVSPAPEDVHDVAAHSLPGAGGRRLHRRHALACRAWRERRCGRDAPGGGRR